jgi:phosphoribosyl 1,2-cyclic phosphate phosphodiesterase
LKNKFTILGSGSSLGAPWITNYMGKLKKNSKNIRTRCCAHIKYGNLSILIDTSPDIKSQFLKNKINSLDAIIYTQKKIPVYGSKRTINALISKYTFCFKPRHGYKPIMATNIIKNKFEVKVKNKKFKITAFDVTHGMIKANGFLFNKIAYISDCNKIPKNSLKNLFNLDCLVIDCLKKDKHPSHFSFNEALSLSKLVKPKKTILTNLHTDLDYATLKKKLPKNILPAYDGLSFNF